MTERAVMLARLAKLVAGPGGDLADRLMEASRTVLGAEGASITVGSPSPTRVTLCTTDPIAARLEEIQDVLNEGPSWDAFRDRVPVVAPLSAASAERWPEFVRAAQQFADPSTVLYALPMRPGRHTLGVLSVYRVQNDLSGSLAESLDSAQFLADTVGAALLLEPDAQGVPDATQSWSGRAEIHQATGMVISQLRLPAADALAILRAHAYAHDTTLADIARQVITRVIDFGKDTP